MKRSGTFLMLLRFSWAAHVFLNTCPCDVPLSTVCVPAKDRVAVPCPNVTGELTLNLIKDQEVISEVQCNEKENNTLHCTVQKNRNGVEVYEDKRQRSVGFVLVSVTESSQGIYRCEGERIFPPPLKKVQSSTRIQVLVEGYICRSHQSSHNHGNNPSQAGLNWIWILMALLSVYSITVTALVIIAWVKLKNPDSQNDYINTKPRAPRDARGKRQLQKPVPRYF